MAEKPGRRTTIAVRILELAMALSPGDALPDTPELARQLEVGETTVYQVRSALTVRGELLYTDHAWRLSPQQRLAGQQSVTRAISGHWLCCLPVGKRVRYFVVDVTQRREVVVFAANAGENIGTLARWYRIATRTLSRWLRVPSPLSAMPPSPSNVDSRYGLRGWSRLSAGRRVRGPSRCASLGRCRRSRAGSPTGRVAGRGGSPSFAM